MVTKLIIIIIIIFKRTPTVSKDPLIPDMVAQHKVNIVISSGGLCALVALQASSKVEFELPVRVVETKDGK